MNILNWCADPKTQLVVPYREDFPPDVEVVRVEADFIRRSINLLVYHQTFPPVPPGMVPEIIGFYSCPRRVIEPPAEKTDTPQIESLDW